MNLQSLISNLTADTVMSLERFMPELVICATIVVLLFSRLFRWTAKIDPFWLALAGSLVAFWYSLPVMVDGSWTGVERQEIFTGMLIYDSMTVFFRMFLLAFVFWFVILVRMTGLADKEDGQDFYSLLLGATLGMCLMASANHLMTVFLAVEMASVPSYVMAGIIKGRRRSSEAALKYAVYGAGAAGVMLYGISLLAGLLNTAHLPTIASKLAALNISAMVESGENWGTLMVLALAALMIMVGLAFKLSAVPFHFWCPDVFEGASAEVDAFLSVASKAAAMALLVRVALGVSAVSAPAATAGDGVALAPPVIVADLSKDVPTSNDSRGAGPHTSVVPARLVAQSALAEQVATSATVEDAQLAPIRTFIVRLLAVIAAITCTFGNLVAYGQTNMKRLLAYSTIAHAGYMIMAVAAAVQMAGTNAGGAREAVAALLVYLVLYVFMNLGAFAIVAFLRSSIQSEEISDYAGLIRSTPITAVAMTVILVSLIGIPPMAGFFGKLVIFVSLVTAGGPWMIGLLVVAGINTVISLIYYLRVAKTMCIDPEPDTRGPVSIGLLPAAYVLVLALPVVYYGIMPSRVMDVATEAAKQILM